MKYSFAFLLMATLLVFSCRTVKKTQAIQDAFNKKDSSQTIVISTSPAVDSAAIVKDILEKTVRRKIDFVTFNAKIKVDYEGPEKSENYTAYLSMRKDSIILIKIKGSFLGISAVGLEAKIDKDSVILVQLVGEKSVMRRSISYLQEITQIPFDFYTLQDLLIGNPVFMDGNVVSFKAGATELLVLMVGNVFKHLLTLNNTDFSILHSKLDDVDIQRNRTCDISLSAYQPMGIYQFATYRKITLSEKSKLDIYMDFKEFILNEPLKYHFDIPKNFRRK
ncbi:MAG: DUF4292 domain-containing protein [Chitinophagaceae bacterium]|nr:DUF4292 domain-containing protein [Chitinophagaceae bacterium]MDP1762781.1 DUF4292 domain-containing protein [Sediminibacterium sp.]MDP3665540.1 DUF4292 domain-containing protein [Sediminibacterium sp.]